MEVRPATDAVELRAELPGPLLSLALPRGADGRRAILALVASGSPGGPVVLQLDPATRALSTVSVPLPAAVDTLAAVDLDGDGVDELLAGRPGALLRLGPSRGNPALLARERTLLREESVNLRHRPAERGSVPDGLRLAAVGVALDLRLTHRDRLAPAHRIELPLRAERSAAGLVLSSLPATVLWRRDGTALYAVGPEAVDQRRLRSLLIDPATDPPRTVEAWSRLPGPEAVQDSWYELIDDRPVLIVSTNSADKLGVLEKQRLRIFGLHADRTQSGCQPLLAAVTAARRWVSLRPAIGDLDADGVEDLVVVESAGLGGMKLVVEAYLGSGRGGFQPDPWRSELDLPGSEWSWGGDVDGDARADLVVLSGGDLEVFTGTGGHRRRVVDRKPRWLFPGDDSAPEDVTVEVGSDGVAVDRQPAGDVGRPQVLDLDADGRPELLLAANREGRGRLRLILWSQR